MQAGILKILQTLSFMCLLLSQQSDAGMLHGITSVLFLLHLSSSIRAKLAGQIWKPTSNLLEMTAANLRLPWL